MDSRTGYIYSEDEVEEMRRKKEDIDHMVTVFGKPEDVHRVSTAVKRMHSEEQKAARRAKNKRAKASRKKNRHG